VYTQAARGLQNNNKVKTTGQVKSSRLRSVWCMYTTLAAPELLCWALT